jgi:hypothetical protein
MFVAEVIVPFAIDQAYIVAPAGPDAELPVEFAQTSAGVGVMVGGVGVTEISLVAALLLSVPSFTTNVTVRVSALGLFELFAYFTTRNAFCHCSTVAVTLGELNVRTPPV